MTSFIAWRAGSKARPGSLYFASDSRRSWKNGNHRDDCIKLFAPTKSPDIFGIVGNDISLPERVLPELCNAIDAGAIPQGTATSAYGRNEWIQDKFRIHLDSTRNHGNFSVFHGSRNHFGVCATFLIFHLQYISPEDRLMNEEITLPEDGSCSIAVTGSGAQSMGVKVDLWKQQLGSYSRSFFSGFCDALAAAEDSLTGGAPQLLALGNTGCPMHLGVITQKGNFYRGSMVRDVIPHAKWRNEQFELVNHYGQLLENAQAQPRPELLKR